MADAAVHAKPPGALDAPIDKKARDRSPDAAEDFGETKNGAVEPIEKAEVEKAKGAPMIKTSAKIDYKARKKNIKYDASTLPASSDQHAIRRQVGCHHLVASHSAYFPPRLRAIGAPQVEFYFSDSNLPIDKFMWNKTGGSENKPIPVKLVSTFSRMRRFRPYETIVTALRESNALVVAGEKGEETIKRKMPYATEKRDNVSARSIYAKGFGDETPTTQFELEAFFTQFGPVNSVRLRRTPEMLFKGSVFVEFATQDSQKKFLERDPKPTWNGHELLIMSKTAYVDDKCSQIREGKIQPSKKTLFFEGKEKVRPFDRKEKHFDKNSPDRNWHKGGRGRRGGRGGRGGFRGGRRSGPDVDVASVDIAAAAIEEE